MRKDIIEKIENIKNMAVTMADAPGKEAFMAAIEDCLNNKINFSLAIAIAGKTSQVINPPEGCDKEAFTTVNAVCLYCEKISKGKDHATAMIETLELLKI